MIRRMESFKEQLRKTLTWVSVFLTGLTPWISNKAGW